MRHYRTAIFINGCFWHGHEGCDNFRMPKSNIEFWEAKINRNRERDKHNYQVLHDNGWQVIVLWECRLTKELFETTMQEVEILLHSYCLATIGSKVKEYIRTDEDDVMMAAEAEYDYGE